MSLNRENSVSDMLIWLARLVARELERHLAPLDMTPAYLPVLFALADGRVLTQKSLADLAAVEQPTMTATLNRMQRDGFIVRRRNPEDGRSALVALTPLGRDRLPDVERVMLALNALALEHLTGEERRDFLRFLRRVTAIMEMQVGRNPADQHSGLAPEDSAPAPAKNP